MVRNGRRSWVGHGVGGFGNRRSRMMNDLHARSEIPVGRRPNRHHARETFQTGFDEMNSVRGRREPAPWRNLIDTAFPDGVSERRGGVCRPRERAAPIVGKIFLAVGAVRDLPTTRGRPRPVAVQRDKGLYSPPAT
jgi:hypothetical protein